MNIVDILIGASLTLGGLYFLFQRRRVASRLFGWYNRPRREGAFAWVDVRIAEPGEFASLVIATIFAILVAAIGFAVVVTNARDVYGGAASYDGSMNLGGLLAGTILYGVGMYLLLRKGRIANRLSSLHERREAQFSSFAAPSESVGVVVLSILGFLTCAAGLTVVVLSFS